MDNKVSQVEEKLTKANVADMPVAQFMTKQVIPLYADTTIRSAIHTFFKHQISGAPVVDQDGVLKGVVSEHDLLLQAATKDLDSTISYTSPAITVKVDARLKDLTVLFYKKKIKRIPVMGAGQRVVGVVSRIDLLTQLALSE